MPLLEGTIQVLEDYLKRTKEPSKTVYIPVKYERTINVTFINHKEDWAVTVRRKHES